MALENDSSPFEVVCHILNEHCEVEQKISLSHKLIDDLELESVLMLTLIAELENHYRVVFDVDNASPFETVDDIVKYIERQSLK